MHFALPQDRHWPPPPPQATSDCSITDRHLPSGVQHPCAQVVLSQGLHWPATQAEPAGQAEQAAPLAPQAVLVLPG